MEDYEENKILRFRRGLKMNNREIWENEITKMETYPLAQWIASGGYNDQQLEKIFSSFGTGFCRKKIFWKIVWYKIPI